MVANESRFRKRSRAGWLAHLEESNIRIRRSAISGSGSGGGHGVRDHGSEDAKWR